MSRRLVSGFNALAVTAFCLGALLLFSTPAIAADGESPVLQRGPLAGRSTLAESAEVVLIEPSPGAGTELQWRIFDWVDGDLEEVDVASSGGVPDGEAPAAIVSAGFAADGIEEVVAAWEGTGRTIELSHANGAPSGFGFGNLIVQDGTDLPLLVDSSPRPIKLATGSLDLDPEDELVLGYWDENGNVTLAVYELDASGTPVLQASISDASIPLQYNGPEGSTHYGHDRFAVEIADFDGDLVDEIALVHMSGAPTSPYSPNDLTVRFYSFERAAGSEPALMARGSHDFTIAFGFLSDCGIDCVRARAHVLDTMGLRAARLSPKPSRNLGVRPFDLVLGMQQKDYLVVERRLPPIGGPFRISGVLAGHYVSLRELKVARGPGECDDLAVGALEFCILSISVFTTNSNYPPSIVAVDVPPSYLVRPSIILDEYLNSAGAALRQIREGKSAFCFDVGDLAGDVYDEIAFARNSFVQVYRPGESRLASGSGNIFSVPRLRQACDLQITDLNSEDAVFDDGIEAWTPEIVVVNAVDDPTLESPLYRQIAVLRPGFDESGDIESSLSLVSTPQQSEALPFSAAFPPALGLATPDLDSDAVRLGQPSRQSHSTLQPLVVLGAPPTHFDIHYASYDDACVATRRLEPEVIDAHDCYDVSSPGCDFFSVYSTSTTAGLAVSSNFQTDWGLGVNVQLSTTPKFLQSVTGGLSLELDAYYGEGFGEFEQDTNETTLTIERFARRNDQVYGLTVGYEIYEYPVFAGTESEPQAFLTAVQPLPGVDLRWRDAGRPVLDGTRVLYEPRNLLSYPSSSQVGDLRFFLQFDEQGNQQFGFDDYQNQSFDVSPNTSLTWTVQRVTSSQTSDTSSWNAQFKAEASLDTPNVDVSVRGDYSASGLSTQESTASDAQGMEVVLSELPSPIGYAYDMVPYMHWERTTNALRLDYALDIFAADEFWGDYYGCASDPAFSQPRRFDVEKGNTSDDSRRYETRELRMEPADPVAGEQVTLLARVHNYSLVPTPERVMVRFYDGDPRSGGTPLVDDWTGQDFVLTTTLLPPRESQDVTFRWTVPEATGLPCEIWAELDPMDSIPDEIHETTDPIHNNLAWRGVNATCVPEPASATMACVAIGVLAVLRRRAICR